MFTYDLIFFSFFKFENQEYSLCDNDNNNYKESSIPIQNHFMENIGQINEFVEDNFNNNLILIQKNQDNYNNNNYCSRRGSIILKAPSRKGSSYIRSTKKDISEAMEKRYLDDLYNLIRFKFNELSLEDDLQGNFQLNLNIPYIVRKNFLSFLSYYNNIILIRIFFFINNFFILILGYK